MQEWKQVVSFIAIAALVAWGFLPWIQFGNLLDDPEFDTALERAKANQFSQIDETVHYPFTTMTRVEAADRYAHFGDVSGIQFQQEVSACQFDDIENVSETDKQNILKVCQFGFLKGREGKFHPDQYISKAESLVGLVRVIAPWETFAEELNYWNPYVTRANEHGITERKASPYLMYLVTKYELLLQLYRAYQMREQTQDQEIQNIQKQQDTY